MSRLLITDIKQGGHASIIGIKTGDYLYRYDSIEVVSNEQLSTLISNNSKSYIQIELFRDGRIQKIDALPGPLGISALLSDYPHEEGVLKFVKQSKVQLTTAPTLSCYKIVRTIEIIGSECALGINILGDLFSGLTDTFGGRDGVTQNALKQARMYCLDELKREADMVGANAVIAVNLSYSEFTGKGKSMLFLVASGTAVVIEKI